MEFINCCANPALPTFDPWSAALYLQLRHRRQASCQASRMSAKEGFLSAIHALLLEQGLGKARVAILAKQLEKNGGKAEKTLSDTTTHILVGNNTRLARVPVLLKIPAIPERVSVLRADWLSACLTQRQLVSEESYRVHQECAAPPATTVVTKVQILL